VHLALMTQRNTIIEQEDVRHWIDRIDSIQLEKITAQAVQTWKVDFLSRAGQNPALRGTRNLFSPARLKFIAPPAGFSSPFTNVCLEPRQAMRYRSSFYNAGYGDHGEFAESDEAKLMRFRNHAALPHFSRGPRVPRFLKPALKSTTTQTEA